MAQYCTSQSIYHFFTNQSNENVVNLFINERGIHERLLNVDTSQPSESFIQSCYIAGNSQCRSSDCGMIKHLA